MDTEIGEIEVPFPQVTSNLTNDLGEERGDLGLPRLHNK